MGQLVWCNFSQICTIFQIVLAFGETNGHSIKLCFFSQFHRTMAMLSRANQPWTWLVCWKIEAMQWVSLKQEVKNVSSNLTSIYENQTFDQGLVNVRKLSKTALFVYVFVVFVHYIQTQEKVVHTNYIMVFQVLKIN